MRALVTGGAGFIGSHLTEALLAAGREVVVLDDLSTGQLGNLAGVAGHPRLEVVAGSVTDETLVRKLVTGADLVYHLAAAVGVRLILDRPVATIETNIMGTETILRAALEGRPRVVLASTSEVYGKNDRVPLSEDDDRLLGPTTKSRWSYACSKAIDEFLGLAYHREHGLPVTIVRFFNTIGPRQTGRYGMVVPRFVRQALDGGPITVYGDGCQSRCFTDVEDTVRATIALSLAPAAVGEVFNVGTTHELTIRTLAERVRALAGSDSPIVLVPYDEAYQPGFEDLHRRVPDIRKAERVVGYRPRVPLDETLQRVIGHLREHRPQLGRRAPPRVRCLGRLAQAAPVDQEPLGLRGPDLLAGPPRAGAGGPLGAGIRPLLPPLGGRVPDQRRGGRRARPGAPAEAAPPRRLGPPARGDRAGGVGSAS